VALADAADAADWLLSAQPAGDVADELWSWSFAADPVHELVVSASRSNPAELVYDLGLHYWMAAFGDSVVAMRMLSVLAMAGRRPA